MKKILVVGMSPQVGGIETFLIQVFRNINRDEISFDFLTFWNKCAYEDELKANGSSVYHLTRRGANPFKSYLEQRRFFKSHSDDYDYVWINLSSSSNILTHKMSRKYTNAKIISHCHGTAFESRRGLVHFIHSALSKINFKQFLNCTDYCFACSQAAGEWLFKDKRKFYIVKNGVDVEKFAFNQQARDMIRKEFNIEDKFVIGHVGRFCEVKNHAFLIDLFDEYHKKDQNSVLLLVGNGELEENIKQRVKERSLEDSVIFTGFRSDVQNFYQAFDVFVLPSLFEGFPMSIVEAQTSGLPVLVSDVITREVDVTKDVAFISLSQNDEWIEKLSEVKKLERKINNKILIKENNFSFDNTIETLIKIFNETAGE